MIDQLYILPVLLFSVVIHELAHGWMALRLGDPTAKEMGRITLNPIPHIDLVGSIIVPLVSIAMAGRVFIAWAKPVPINPANFSNPRRDDILVSVVGPLSNLLMALACSLALVLVVKGGAQLTNESSVLAVEIHSFLLNMFAGGITLNVVLAVFNMLPIPPLDGSHVLASMLPENLSVRFRSVGFFGIFAILMLMRWDPFAEAFSMMIGALVYPYQQIIRYLVQ
jgi:Zn-dependent protease